MIRSRGSALWVGICSLLLAGCAQQYGDPAAVERAAGTDSALVGHPAPDFTLPDQDGDPVQLSSLRGRWVVVYFYPADDTPGCTCQASEFTSLLEEFREMNATVLGVSPDSPEDHRHFRGKHDLELTLLSDEGKRVMSRYGAWVRGTYGNEGFGRVIRSTVIIDPEGIIRRHWPEVVPRGHAERVRKALAALQEGDRSMS